MIQDSYGSDKRISRFQYIHIDEGNIVLIVHFLLVEVQFLTDRMARYE